MRKLSFVALLASSLAAGSWSIAASAHTTSLGYVPGDDPGEVTFWTGSYDHGGIPANEGLGTLTSVSTGISQTVAFSLGPVSTRPDGLVDGTNNFFWGDFDGTRYPFPLSTDPVLFGGVEWWQGITFTGLTPGDSIFGCGAVCGVTAQWSSLNGAGDTVRLTLTGRDIGGAVPEPGTWAMMLLGFGATGFAMRRSRKGKPLAQLA